MLYWNLQLPLLRSPLAAAAPPGALGTWVRVMGYACEQECNGRLRGAVQWSDRQWLVTCNVAADDVLNAAEASLLRFDGDDVVVWSYPTQRQAGIELLRAEGAAGGSVRSSAKANAARLNGRLGGRPRIRQATSENPAETQQKPNETQHEKPTGMRFSSQPPTRNPREYKGRESVCATTTTHETDDQWLTRIRRDWPGVNLDRELRRARSYVQRARGEDAPLQRRWFECEWLPRCADPAAPARIGKSTTPPTDAEAAPEGWKAALAGSVYGEGGIHEAHSWGQLDVATRAFVRSRLTGIRVD